MWGTSNEDHTQTEIGVDSGGGDGISGFSVRERNRSTFIGHSAHRPTSSKTFGTAGVGMVSGQRSPDPFMSGNADESAEYTCGGVGGGGLGALPSRPYSASEIGHRAMSRSISPQPRGRDSTVRSPQRRTMSSVVAAADAMLARIGATHHQQWTFDREAERNNQAPNSNSRTRYPLLPPPPLGSELASASPSAPPTGEFVSVPSRRARTCCLLLPCTSSSSPRVPGGLQLV
jgi:hypothetical protein